jgi:hypothetical protein
MTAIHETLEQLTLGDIQQAGRLTIVPLGSAEQHAARLPVAGRRAGRRPGDGVGSVRERHCAGVTTH